MKNLTIHSAVLLSVLLFSTATYSMAQETKKTIKRVPISKTSADSGEEMFKAYCAVCHGETGKGDGPASSEFRISPANLTILSKNNSGKFPNNYVAQVLQSGVQVAKAHGSKDMPIWGNLFGSISGGIDSPAVKQRIFNLSQYVESLQSK